MPILGVYTYLSTLTPDYMKSTAFLIFTAAVCLCAPYAGVAQMPDLATASNFAVFTAAGAFSNAGTTQITGDIGYNTGGPLSGFPPGVVTGTIHETDAASIQAQTDIAALYTDLAGRTCGMVLSSTPGSGQVLTPNIYCITGAGTITGNLTLDGMGNPNALFIFQLTGALTTDGFSNLILINSASRANVYWQVNGAVTLGANSAFRGNIVANGAISLLTGAALAGSALTNQGAIELDNNVITVSADVTALPVALHSFSANCINRQIVLSWNTTMEMNNRYYSVQRSSDGMHWQQIGLVNGAGHSDTLIHYTYTDTRPGDDVPYYRLTQTDMDNRVTFLQTIVADKCAERTGELSIHPNPVRRTMTVDYTGDKSQVQSITIYSVQGVKVYSVNGYQNSISIAGKPDGTYFLYFTLPGKTIARRIVLRK